MNPRPILVLGSSGQVGYELLRALAPLAPVAATDRASLDLTDSEALRARVRALRPAAIVNAAAYTAVDQAEAEPAQVAAINGVAPGVLAEAAAEVGAALVHYSTDYVFDGRGERPYREDDATAPLGVYGRSKLAGEQAALERHDAVIVLRTAWVYATRGKNFLLTMQRLARERDELRVVADQWGAPTSARFIAASTASILAQTRLSSAYIAAHRGIYHLAAAGSVHWCDFARAILAATPGAGHVRVAAITTAEYPTPAIRPHYSVLDTTRVATTFALYMPPWHELLELALRDQAGSARA